MSAGHFILTRIKKQQMGKVLIIGAGGVGTVVAHKVAQKSGCIH